MDCKNPKPNNIQRHAFQLTINNPDSNGFTHDVIKRTFIENFTTLKYFCMADEIATTGTYHTHVYVFFTSRVRFEMVKKYFPPAHKEVQNGPAQPNLDNIKKCGIWEDTDKAETKVEGTFEEWGEFPKQKGTRQDMEELYELVKAGYLNSDIIAVNNDYILHLDKIDKLRTILLTDKFKGIRRIALKVIYISGATGTGKTRDILDTYGDSNVFRVVDYAHPFDSYQCQPVLCFDEYRSQLRLADMLCYLDIYPIELPARYSNKYLCAETIFIVSNWTLEMQYQEIQPKDRESWNAFLRRIHEVRTYDNDGKVTVYDSVQKYLRRGEKFHTMTDSELQENPFNKKLKEEGELNNEV